MPSIKDLRRRIVTTHNTQATTRAMKMVSAAKLRRAQDAIINQRPYARQVQALFKLISQHPEITVVSPLIKREAPVNGKKKLLLMCITSDRGLCGGFNGNVIKAAQSFLRDHGDEYGSIELGFVGRRGYDFFKSRKINMGPYAPDLGGKVSFLKGRKLAALLIEQYLSGKADEVKVIYNEFKNAVSQRVLVENYLPFLPDPVAIASVKDEEPAQEMPLFVVKPSPSEVLEDLLSRYFAVEAFRILLESQAGEHGARMSAMENATKNAEEMIRKLTLQYNKQRQASITNELLEITAGSESQKT